MAENSAKKQSDNQPHGPASGDLSGSYPNPTVAKLQGNPISSSVLSSATDKYVLTWINSDGQWEAKNIATYLAANPIYGSLLPDSFSLSLTGGATTKLPFKVAGISNGITLDAVNHNMTVLSSGQYELIVCLGLEAGSGIGDVSFQFSLEVYKNGSSLFNMGFPLIRNTYFYSIAAQTVLDLSANDVIDIRANNITATFTLSNDGSGSFFLYKIK